MGFLRDDYLPKNFVDILEQKQYKNRKAISPSTQSNDMALILTETRLCPLHYFK
jgi:hypothetical protein